MNEQKKEVKGDDFISCSNCGYKIYSSHFGSCPNCGNNKLFVQINENIMKQETKSAGVWVKVDLSENKLPEYNQITIVRYLHGNIKTCDAQYIGLINDIPTWLGSYESSPFQIHPIEWLDESEQPVILHSKDVVDDDKITLRNFGQAYKSGALDMIMANEDTTPDILWNLNKEKYQILPESIHVDDNENKLNESIINNLHKAMESSEQRGADKVRQEYIDTVGKCAACGVEYHIHKESQQVGEQPVSNDKMKINYCYGEAIGGHCCYPDKSCEKRCEVTLPNKPKS